MIIRTYECMDCRTIFEVTCESNDLDPSCPVCWPAIQLASDKFNPDRPVHPPAMEWRPQSFNIGTVKGKAVDAAQKIIEEDFQITNFNDQQREGDVAFRAEPETRQQREEKQKTSDQIRHAMNIPGVEEAMRANDPATAAALRTPGLAPQMKGFWGPAGSAPVHAAAAMAGAKQGPAADVNPMTILHRGLEKGEIPDKVRSFRPVGKA